jgi:hypothetical protein
LNDDEEQHLTAALRAGLGYPYRMTCRRMDRIPRSSNGKFEDFISRVDE